MTWMRHKDSPFGDVEICDHFCIRGYGSNSKCVYCDYPEDVNMDVRKCPECKSGTWHKEKVCCRCGSLNLGADIMLGR